MIIIYIDRNNINKQKLLKIENDKLIEKNIFEKNISLGKKDISSDKKIKENNSMKLYSKAACVYDCNSNRLLYSKNAYEKLPMASTTKIMTCIIALENIDLDEEIIVSKYAASMPDVQLNAIRGQKFKLEDLLYSLMLESHNDIAVAIAENIAAKKYNRTIDIDNIEHSKELVKLYGDMMNKKARELHLKNTNFVTPNGLDHEKHYTTAEELAIITDYAIKNNKFIEIINKKTHSFSSDSGKRYIVTNKNQFLNMYADAIGCKTGYTSKAGYCFVGAIDRKDYKLVSVVLGCGWPPHKAYKWQDTINLMDYTINNYKKNNISVDNTMLNDKTVDVYDGKNLKKMNINLAYDDSLLVGKDEKITIKTCVASKLVAPIEKNKIIGYMKIMINDMEYDKLYIKTDRSIKNHTIRSDFYNLLQNFLISKVDFKK